MSPPSATVGPVDVAGIDRRTGLVSEQAPSQLLQGEFGVVALSPLVPMWCEAFTACAALGRLSGVEDGAVCFVGVIKSVEVRLCGCVILCACLECVCLCVCWLHQVVPAGAWLGLWLRKGRKEGLCCY